jgi:hypothetical protein
VGTAGTLAADAAEVGASGGRADIECDLLCAAHWNAVAGRAGAVWPGTTAFNRFNRWSRRGIWKRVFDTRAAKSHDSLHLFDSTIVKAHRSASGAKGGRKIMRSASAEADAARKSMPVSTARVDR